MSQNLLRLVCLALMLLALGHTCYAQTPTFSRAMSIGPSGGSGNAEGHAVAVDALGNTYVTGLFAGTIQLGSFTLSSAGLSTSTLPPVKSLYVAKYSPAGVCLWATISGGNHFGPSATSEFPSFQSIAVDNAGGIYVAGSFNGRVSFGAFSLTSNASSYTDFFVARLDAAGNWTSATAGRSGQVRGIAVNGSGNAYVVGVISSQSTFGSLVLQSAGDFDVFVAKLSSTGTWLWAVCGGSDRTDWGNGITLDAAGNAYITGALDASYTVTTFGSITLAANAPTNSGADIFVAKVSATGNWQWAIRAGATNRNDAGEAIAHDASGNLYLTGYHGGGTFGSTVLPTAGAADVFVAKLDANGSWLWAIGGGGSASDNGVALAVDGSGNAYLTGPFSGYSTNPVGSTASFGSTTLSRSGTSGADVFMAKVSSAGAWLWAQRGGGTGDDQGYGIATDGGGVVCATGAYGSLDAAFGASTLALNATTAAFLTRVNTLGGYSWAGAISGASRVSEQAVAVDNQGNYYVSGSFTGTCVLGTTTLTSTGAHDSYVAKMDALGNYRWAVKGSGTGTEMPVKLATDAAGNVFVTGTCGAGSVSFGSLSQTLVRTSTVVAKLDIAGNALWLASSTGSWPVSAPTVTGMAVDGNGDAYLTGYFINRTASFGSTTLTNAAANVISTEALMQSDVFVAKLSSAGTWLWAVQGGSGGVVGSAGGGVPAVNATDYSGGIAADATDGLYITGSFNATARNPAYFGRFALSTISSEDAFVAKLSASTGAWQWVAQSRASASAYAANFGIGVDAAGDVYTTGICSGTTLFGSSSLTGVGANSTYVAKINPAGAWQWVTGSTGRTQCVGIAIDGNGAAYIAGLANGAATFGSTTLTGIGGNDAFIAKMNSSGVWQWAINAGGEGNDVVTGITVNGSGTACITGASWGSVATFSPYSLPGNNGMGVGFIAWLGNTALAAQPSLPKSDFTVWPNPSRGQVWVKGLPAGQMVAVYNVTGQLVATRFAPALHVEWELGLPTKLPAGMYFIRSGKASRQLIIN